MQNNSIILNKTKKFSIIQQPFSSSSFSNPSISSSFFNSRNSLEFFSNIFSISSLKDSEISSLNDRKNLIFQQNKISLTYGEINEQSFREIFQIIFEEEKEFHGGFLFLSFVL